MESNQQISEPLTPFANKDISVAEHIYKRGKRIEAVIVLVLVALCFSVLFVPQGTFENKLFLAALIYMSAISIRYTAVQKYRHDLLFYRQQTYASTERADEE